MNPLSPLYFIKQNKSRCILLMFMIFLSFGAYLGGSYIYTPQENWDYACELDEKMVSVYARSDDEDYKNYHKFVEEIKKTDNIHAIERAWYNQIVREAHDCFTHEWVIPRTRKSMDIGCFFDYLDK